MVDLWPMRGIQNANPRQGGYAFGAPIDNGAFHPGIDGNASAPDGTPGKDADCGNALVAVASGGMEIVWSGHSAHPTSGLGFGYHLWGRALRSGVYPHYCHAAAAFPFQPTPTHQPVVQRDSVIGSCGKTAGWDACHLHFELWNGAVYGPPPAWDFWPTPSWVSVLEGRLITGDALLAWVREHYLDPVAWLEAEDGAAASALVSGIDGDTATAEDLRAMTDAQWRIVGRRIWGARAFVSKLDATPPHAIPTAWIDSAKTVGGYLGRPLTAELQLADGSGGVWQEFARGFIVWTPERGVEVFR